VINVEEKETQKILDAINKKKKFSKKIVVLVILLNILFTVAVFVAAFFNAIIPDSLIGAWFAFTTGELWFLSTIKKSEGGQ
jgi:pheromone shutdown protein TraB